MFGLILALTTSCLRALERNFMAIPRDVQEFLDCYPGNVDNPSQRRNLQFYSNERRCQPDGLLIEELLSQWEDDFDTLEYEHGYIQWLFPIREYGMNGHAQPLQEGEIQDMKASPETMSRVLRSYKLMLSFYGMTLIDDETGLLERSDQTYKARYRNLVRSPHNYLRISRILKNLSEMGLEHLNAGFLLHVVYEQSINDQLNVPYLRSSMDRWWANCIRNEEERAFIREVIANVRSGKLEFTKDMYHGLLERRKEGGKLSWELKQEEETSNEIETAQPEEKHDDAIEH